MNDTESSFYNEMYALECSLCMHCVTGEQLLVGSMNTSKL